MAGLLFEMGSQPALNTVRGHTMRSNVDATPALRGNDRESSRSTRVADRSTEHDRHPVVLRQHVVVVDGRRRSAIDVVWLATYSAWSMSMSRKRAKSSRE